MDVTTAVTTAHWIQNLVLTNEIIYRPILNLLVIFLKIFGGNLGLAVIFLTLLVRAAMIKQTLAGNDMQKGMGALQPKLAEIQEKYKDDPKRVSAETMKVFKTDGKGAFKGCLMMLIQIPVFIGLFYVVSDFANIQHTYQSLSNSLYSFFFGFGHVFTAQDALTNGVVNTHFLGMDLTATKNIFLTIIAAIFTYLQTKFTTLAKPATPAAIPGQKAPDMGKMMGFMNIFLVIMIASFVYTMNAGVGLYIVTTTLFSVVQYGWQYREILKIERRGWISKGKKGVVINPKK